MPPAPRASRPAAAPTTRFKSGQRVKHKLFGEGIVIDSHVRGDDEEVDVAFEDVGLKRLVAKLKTVAPEVTEAHITDLRAVKYQ